jgi:hypothetical protein
MLLIVYFSYYIFLGGSDRISMGSWMKVSLWCVGAAILLFAVGNLIKGTLSVSELIKRALTVIGCVLVIAMLFVPYFTSHVTGTFDGCTLETVVKLPVDASLFDAFSMSKEVEQKMNELETLSKEEKQNRINDYLKLMLAMNTRELKEDGRLYNHFIIVTQL